MEINTNAVRVVIYLSEEDRHQGGPLYLALLELLRQAGAQGGTAMRGVAGFGAHRQIHTMHVVTLANDLPVVVEWVGAPEQVEQLMPQVRRLVGAAPITMEPVQLVGGLPPVLPETWARPIYDVMQVAVTTVHPDAPAEEVIRQLLRLGHRALPVVNEDGILVGILTAGDLLRRLHLRMRLGLQDLLSDEEVAEQMRSLEEQALTAADMMARDVVTALPGETIRTVAARMDERSLKRLPVVDNNDRLLGLVSRIDLLRALQAMSGHHIATTEAATTGGSIRDLMVSPVPTVQLHAGLDTILHALESNRRRRVVVVDAADHVLGIITDGDLLRRSVHRRHPGLLARLRSLVAGERPEDGGLPGGDERAADLMTHPVVTVQMDAGLDVALGLILEHGIKRLPVVDGEGRLVGLLGRRAILRGLLELSQAADPPADAIGP